jgi:eukaryotic-like serine/threonine-protein kinase
LRKAIAEIEEAVMLANRQPIYLAGLGHAYAVAGKREEALKTILKLNELSTQTFVPARGVAVIYLGLGDKNRRFVGWIKHLKSETAGFST